MDFLFILVKLFFSEYCINLMYNVDIGIYEYIIGGIYFWIICFSTFFYFNRIVRIRNVIINSVKI